jgi:hypothetical protein
MTGWQSYSVWLQILRLVDSWENEQTRFRLRGRNRRDHHRVTET